MRQPPAVSFPDNDWADILDAQPEDALNSEGAHIVHKLLIWDYQEGAPLRFLAVDPDDRPTHIRNIRNYAMHVAANPSKHSGHGAIETPLDIDPGFGLPSPRYCFLLLELDHSVNWLFTEGSQGLSAKQDAYPHDDADLHFATDNAVFSSPTYRVPAKCRVLYWSILKRTPGVIRPFNFHISTFQTDAGEERWLPLIFDPNVPNSGGTGIP
jgi:hypothetical protein